MTPYRKTKSLSIVMFAWGPVLILMALIFVASSQPKVGPAAGTPAVYFSGAMPIFAGGWDTLVKKGGHVLGYGLLAVLMLRALRANGRTPREAAVIALLLTLSYAVTDELHQAFVPGRSSSVLDIGLDYLGAMAAALIAWQFAARRKGTALALRNKLSP